MATAGRHKVGAWRVPFTPMHFQTLLKLAAAVSAVVVICALFMLFIQLIFHRDKK